MPEANIPLPPLPEFQPPFRRAFDAARDPLTARNALGIIGDPIFNETRSITTGTTTLDTTDNGKIIFCDASGGNITVAFAANAALDLNWFVRLVRVDSSANTVTVDPSGTETIDGRVTARLVSRYDEASIVKQGVNFVTVAAKFQRHVVVYNSTGANTFTVATDVPLGCNAYRVEAWGAGGSGAGSDTTTPARKGGGGAGEYFSVTIATSLDTSLTCTVGTGGTGVAAAAAPGTVGNGGGDTTVVGSNLGTLTAKGGAGGLTSSAGGLGGTGGGGTVDERITGADGFASRNDTVAVGYGGDSPRGGPGGHTNVNTAGRQPGGGGTCSNHVASTSGAGGNGRVTITMTM